MLADLLFDLVRLSGPSGHEGVVAERLASELEAHCDEVRLDKMGNLMARREGRDPARSLMLVAHTDEVSLVVRQVDGLVWFDTVGWIDPACLMGVPVTVLTESGEVPGVICSTSAHSPTRADLPELWIDVGESISGVEVGDPVVFAPNARWLGPHTLASKAIDDRVGCAVLVDVARSLSSRPKSTVHFVAAVQEEVNSNGARFVAQQLRPDWAIAVDTTGAQDAATDRYRVVPLGSGPVVRRFQMAQPSNLYPAVTMFPSRRLNRLLLDTARELGLPINQDVYRHTFTDTAMVQLASPETECANLLIPRRYAHSPCEVLDVRDGERTAQILTAVAQELA